MPLAVVCNEWCEPRNLELIEVPAPPVAFDEVRIAVDFAGVNFADTLMIAGKYQVRPPLPFTPGAEAAGVVLEVGAGVTRIAPGQRVVASHYYGAFAEQMVAPERGVVALPEGVDEAAAAALPVIYGTVAHALRDRGNLRPGETLVVHGAAGGIGIAAVELGKQLGATVIGTVGSEAKADLVRRYGADHVIDYSRESIRDRVRALTAGRGADVICDTVGGEAFDQSLRCINWNGRLLVVGFAGGRIPRVPANLALLKGCSVVGVNWPAFVERTPERHRAHVADVLDRVAAGALQPPIGLVLPLDRVADALEALLARTVTGKVVLKVA